MWGISNFHSCTPYFTIKVRSSFELLETKQINVENMSTIYNLENLNEAIKDTQNGKILKAFIKVGD